MENGNQKTLILCCAIFGICCGLVFSFTQDDSFISYRYARNAAEGHGLRFNYSETVPVEGFTNMLWVLSLIPVFWLNLDPVIISKLYGIFAGFGTLFYIIKAVQMLTSNKYPVMIAGIMAGLNISFAVWAVSGMETMLFTLCTIASLYHAANVDDTSRATMHLNFTILWSALAVLIRPEGVLTVLVVTGYFLVSAFQNKKFYRKLCIYLLLLASIGTGYSLFKLAYFKTLIPNTFHAKVILDYSVRLIQGAYYIRGWFFTLGSMLIIWSVVGIVYYKRSGLFLLNIISATVIVSYSWVIGGDFMQYYRFLLPAQASLIITAVSGAYMLLQNSSGKRKVLIIIVFTLAAYLWPNLSEYFVYIKKFDIKMPLQESLHQDTVNAKWLRNTFDQNTILATYNIGRIPYYTRFETIDILGLTDPILAKLKTRDDFCSLMEEILSRDPDIIISQREGLSSSSSSSPRLFSLTRYAWQGCHRPVMSRPVFVLENNYRWSDCPELLYGYNRWYRKYWMKSCRSGFVVYERIKGINHKLQSNRKTIFETLLPVQTEN